MQNSRSGYKLLLPVLGVVFGDIGTSPIYTLRECISASGGSVSPDTILGLLSLVFWALTLVVTVKYVAFIMGASYKGEGGIMSLLKLASTHEAKLFEKKLGFRLSGLWGLHYSSAMAS